MGGLDMKRHVTGRLNRHFEQAAESFHVISENRMEKRKLIGSILFLSMVLGFSQAALATTASVSLSGRQGLVTVTYSGTFSSYQHCTDSDPSRCWTRNIGTLWGFRNGSRTCTERANGSAECSGEINTARMANGTYTFKAQATDSQQVRVYDIKTLVVDNTPEISITTPLPNEEVEGIFDIAGTVQFKDNPVGAEGEILIYQNGSLKNAQVL